MPEQTRTCEHCAHWERVLIDRRTPTRVTLPHGECSCPKFIYDPSFEELLEDGLSYGDDEWYSAFFATGPKFGCIHWGPKP